MEPRHVPLAGTPCFDEGLSAEAFCPALLHYSVTWLPTSWVITPRRLTGYRELSPAKHSRGNTDLIHACLTFSRGIVGILSRAYAVRGRGGQALLPNPRHGTSRSTFQGNVDPRDGSRSCKHFCLSLSLQG